MKELFQIENIQIIMLKKTLPLLALTLTLLRPSCSTFSAQSPELTGSWNQRCGDCSNDYVQNSYQSVAYSNSDPLCSQWKENVCLKCAPRSYFNAKGVCQSIDPLCKSFDQVEKKCTECYSGYTLNGDKCTSSSYGVTVQDPLCAEWRNGKCLACASSSYMGPNGLCRMADPNCRTFSLETGACRSCYPGFQVKDGKCLVKENGIIDPLCSKFGADGKCVVCSSKSYLNSQTGRCESIDPLCASYDLKSGACQRCYNGYEIKEGKCLRKADTADSASLYASNPLCSQWKNGVCLSCSSRSFLNQNNVCQEVDPQCREYIKGTGECKTCFDGYAPKGLQCIQVAVTTNQDPFCSRFSSDKLQCVECAPGTFLNSVGKCTLVDTQCKTYSKVNGECLSCYGGYRLFEGKCIVSQDGESYSQYTYSDPFCAQWQAGRCVKCASQSYFNDEKVCTPIDSSCREFSTEKKQCLKCYDGFELDQTKLKCRVKVVSPQANYYGYDDPLCASWVSSTECRKCAAGSYRVKATGRCQTIDPACKSFEEREQACQECYAGWSLVGGKCFSLTSTLREQGGPSPWRCHDWKEGVCQNCSAGYSLSPSLQCVCSGN